MSHSRMKHLLSSDSEFESMNSDCESGSDSDLPPCCKLEAQKRPQRIRQLRLPRNFPSLKFTPPSPTGSISIPQHDGHVSHRPPPRKTHRACSTRLPKINAVGKNEFFGTEPIKSSQITGVGIRIRKHGRRIKPCRPGKPCGPRCARCDRTGRTTRGRRCRPGRICEDGSRPCPLCEPWKYRITVNMKNVPAPSSQPDRYPLGFPRFPLRIAMWHHSINEARPRGRTLYHFSKERQGSQYGRPDIILHSGPSKAYFPLATWSPCMKEGQLTSCYEGPIEVFKSGGDKSPIQTAHISLPHYSFGPDLVTFSWRFPDGREEAFYWKWSKRLEVRDVNEKRHGKGMKCVRNKTGEIVAATMREEFLTFMMAFFRWNMSNDMGDEFECMLVMSRIVAGELLTRRWSDP